MGSYLAPSPSVCFSVFSFCLTYCVWGSPFHRSQVRSSRCFWCLPPVAKVGLVDCVGFLVGGTSAYVLVDEAGSCLSGGQVHVWWCVLGCLWPYYDLLCIQVFQRCRVPQVDCGDLIHCSWGCWEKFPFLFFFLHSSQGSALDLDPPLDRKSTRLNSSH